jgi:sulfur carrier protein
MVLIVNGERRETEARRIAALLAELEFTGTQLAIAVNRGVVPRTRWSEVELREGDAIEIISPRQGG